MRDILGRGSCAYQTSTLNIKCAIICPPHDLALSKRENKTKNASHGENLNAKQSQDCICCEIDGGREATTEATAASHLLRLT